MKASALDGNRSCEDVAAEGGWVITSRRRLLAFLASSLVALPQFRSVSLPARP